MKKRQFPILMYHGVHDRSDDAGNFDPIYSVSVQNFIEQLECLRRAGYQFCLINNALESGDGTRRVVISFDDGDISNFTVALPILMERGIKAEFFVTTDRIDKKGSLTKDQLVDMHEHGMSVQSHGVTHRFLSELSPQELLAELAGSKNILESAMGVEISKLSLPGGRGNYNVLRAARKTGYSHVCNSVFGQNHEKSDSYHLKRVAIKRNMTINEFQKIVEGRGAYYWRSVVKQRVLAIAKKLLGNTRYDKLRLMIIGNEL